MISISKNAYIKLDDIADIDKLVNIADKCGNTYIIIKVKLFGIENIDKCPKFKLGDHERISTNKKIFWKVKIQMFWRSFCK